MRMSLVVVVALAACGDDSTATPDAPASADAPSSEPRTTVAEIRATPLRTVDLLFVVDDSPSMLDKQASLRANFPAFIDALSTPLGGLPDLHLAVVTTDLGTLSSSSSTPAPAASTLCMGAGDAGGFQTNGAPVRGAFLTDVVQADGTRVRNYDGDLAAAFSQMANVGAEGCGFEQTLAAMKAGLENPANSGFVRPDALLAVVFLTDEDDCSVKVPALFGPEDSLIGPRQSFRCTRFGVTCATGGATSEAMNEPGAKAGCTSNETSLYIDGVGEYQTFLRGLKADPQRIVVAGIMAPTAPYEVVLRAPQGLPTPIPTLAESCTYAGSDGTTQAGYPPARLQQFLAGFPDRSATTSICQQDLSGGLTQTGSLVARALGTSCITTDLGPAPDCIVEDVVGAVATALPTCAAAGAARPCWSTVVDAASCPLGANLRLDVLRDTPPDPATLTRMRCVVP